MRDGSSELCRNFRTIASGCPDCRYKIARSAVAGFNIRILLASTSVRIRGKIRAIASRTLEDRSRYRVSDAAAFGRHRTASAASSASLRSVLREMPICALARRGKVETWFARAATGKSDAISPALIGLETTFY